MTIQDLILFILWNSHPGLGIKKLNKLAFFLEFTYIFENDSQLTNADYAAINMGPVINDYKKIMKDLVDNGKIARNANAPEEMEDYTPLERPKELPGEVAGFLKAVLDRYQGLNPKQLEDLTHGLDSYNITVHEHEHEMGGIIDKDLAMLDTSLALTEL